MSQALHQHIAQKFNDPILEWRNCSISGTVFPIYQSDHKFYQKVSPSFGGEKCLIPYPTLCPSERERRRFLFRNQRKLYKRTCDATGKSIISMYDEESPYKVYDYNYWR